MKTLIRVAFCLLPSATLGLMLATLSLEAGWLVFLAMLTTGWLVTSKKTERGAR